MQFPDRITTPLLVITGGRDHNVAAHHTMQMYYALRRLGKRVEWVNYLDGGYGVPISTETNACDYYPGIADWYSQYLKKR